MKKIYKSVLCATLLLFMACGSNEEKTFVDDSPAVKVVVQNVKTDNNNPFLTVSGKIQASNSANLSTRMMGFVTKTHVKVGDKVSKGQLLISINNTDLQAKAAQINANITEATAVYKNTKKDYQRFQNLFAENSASQKELDDMMAQFEMAKARLEVAKQMKNEVNAQFSYANIRSPFSGVITNTFIEKGDMANPGVPLIAVETQGQFEVIATVPENEILRIKNNTEVDVLIKSIDKSVKGKVTEVSTSAKNTGGQYLVKINLGKTDTDIFSGMYAMVQFPVENTPATKNRVLIPTKALVNNGQLSGVYTVSQSNTAVLRWLRLGRVFGDNVEVLSGLSTNESYIVSSEAKLYNGAKVTIE
ncbi:efflux RND transporter periplasmic adaptor subunit [Winogradskyella sp.]|uniref:efflux RND transporter periplasmic adaptor subunit n=1 Tax=Winogradskyella sp. TaxID=1883156 RepID=UPI002605CCE9|nr:efflux RND transporter periplasmic adaptor subunit [Winogradskyella sp.]